MKPQLHVSGLNMLQGCGEQYRRRYIEGEKFPPSVAMVRGSSVDRAANADLKAKKDTGKLLPADEVTDLAAQTAKELWREGVYLPKAADEEEPTTEGQLVDVAVSLAGFHHRELAPIVTPRHVQREWTLEIAGLPVDLTGTMDLHEEDSTIADLKTAAKSPSRGAADESTQLTTYALAEHVIDATPRETIHRVRLDYLVRTPKCGDLKLVQLSSTRTVEDFQPLLERVNAAVAAMHAGVFVPANESSWQCSEKFCGYWQTCRYARRPKQIAMSGGK